MKLHRQPAHAGSSGQVGPAGSPACRGWCSGKVKADRTWQDAKSGETNPPEPDQDCHKFCYGSAFNLFGGWLEVKSKATLRGGFLFAAGCLCRDLITGSRETGGSQARQRESLTYFLAGVMGVLQEGMVAWDGSEVPNIRPMALYLELVFTRAVNRASKVTTSGRFRSCFRSGSWAATWGENPPPRACPSS